MRNFLNNSNLSNLFKSKREKCSHSLAKKYHGAAEHGDSHHVHAPPGGHDAYGQRQNSGQRNLGGRDDGGESHDGQGHIRHIV